MNTLEKKWKFLGGGGTFCRLGAFEKACVGSVWTKGVELCGSGGQ